YKFKWFQPFLDAKEAEFHTAGSLFGGRKVWILAQLNRDPVKITKNDEVLKFILLSDSFDGSSAVRAGFTPIRVVCANTLAMAHGNDASKLIRLKHSKSVKDNLEKVREIMNAADAKFTATAEQYKALTRKDVSARDLKNFVELVLKVPDDTDNISTRMRNILQKVYDHFENERGKTWWHAYNSVNTYLNHDKGKRENRVNGLWFGQDAKTNQDALNLALKMAGV